MPKCLVVNVLVTSQNFALILFGVGLVELSGLVIEWAGTVKFLAVYRELVGIRTYLFGSPSKLCRLSRTVWTL